MKHIFITGIAGFLGSHLADHFLKLGYTVSGNDNLLGGYLSNVPDGVTFYQCDCNDKQQMSEITKGVDVLVHTAATAYEGLSVFSPALISEHVLQASVTTFSCAIGNGVKRIVNCSSMARYGNQKSPFTEDMPSHPEDPYAICKVAAENVLKSLCEVHGVEWNIAVPHNIIGPRQKYDDPFRNVVSIMINRCLQDKPPVIYGDGKQMRCFSYVDDCLSSLEKLALDENIVSEIVNIGPDEEFVTIKHLAEIVISITGYSGSPLYVADRPLEVKIACCSSDKARQLLDYKTTVDFVTSVRKTYDYILEQGVKPFEYHLPLEISNNKTPVTWQDNYFNDK